MALKFAGSYRKACCRNSLKFSSNKNRWPLRLINSKAVFVKSADLNGKRLLVPAGPSLIALHCQFQQPNHATSRNFFLTLLQRIQEIRYDKPVAHGSYIPPVRQNVTLRLCL